MHTQTFEELELDDFRAQFTSRRGRYTPRSHSAYAENDSDVQRILQELYESEELLNEGVLSFEFPLLVAEDEELDLFLGKLVRNASRAVGRAAKNIGRGIGDVAKTVGKGVSAIDK